MSRFHPTALPEIPAPPPLDMDWRRAWRSLRTLLADPEDTEKAIDFFYAVGRRDFERAFQRFVRSAHAGRMLHERPSLMRALCDREALRRLPDGSLGRLYVEYLDANGFEPGGLVALQNHVEAKWQREAGIPALDPLRAWYRERALLSHDLLHVLTDYGTDEVGEATLLAFVHGQEGGRVSAFLMLGAVLQVARALGPRWLGYCLRAWRRGRSAVHLAAVPFEALLPLPLDTARQLVGLAPAEAVHPRGILRGTIDEVQARGIA